MSITQKLIIYPLLLSAFVATGAIAQEAENIEPATIRELYQKRIETKNQFLLQDVGQDSLQTQLQTRTLSMAQANLNELDVTMQLVDEDAEDTDDITNDLVLPTQLQDRLRDRDRVQATDNEAGEGIKERIQEMHEHRQEMQNNLKEQQSEIIQHIQNQGGQGGGGGKK